jgi:CopG-like RHH_1 or ribbon-helix-helix domain, RHH_5
VERMPKRPARRRPAPKDRLYFVVPAELGKQLRDLAAREHRSLTSQVQLLLRRALASEADLAA